MPASPIAIARSAAPFKGAANLQRRETPQAGASVAPNDTAPTSTPSTAESALHDAASRGNLPALQALLTSGTAVDARDALGRTALMLAAKGDSQRLLQTLLDAGADPGARDAAGLSAADHARRSEHADWLPLLQPQR